MPWGRGIKGPRRRRRWWVLACIVTAACIGGVLLLFHKRPVVWFDATEITKGPVPVEEARSVSPIPLPDSARNVYVYIFSQGPALDECVMFDAPVEDCMGHAALVLEQAGGAGAPGGAAPEMQAIDPEVSPQESGTADLPEWFDVGTIREGSVSTGLGSFVPRVWVDAARGVFYYRRTD